MTALPESTPGPGRCPGMVYIHRDDVDGGLDKEFEVTHRISTLTTNRQ